MNAETRFSAMLFLFALTAAAQDAAPDGTIPPAVHDGGIVTFRVRPPVDAAVALHGDWMQPGETMPMTKQANGIWTIATQPLKAGKHAYWFEFESESVPKPEDTVVTRTVQRTREGEIEVRGSAVPWEPGDVPHGTVLNEMTGSAVLRRADPLVVYLPPGYYANRSVRYPVLYLLHGAPGAPENWTTLGRADVILDNLIAEGKAKPMIVVMPTVQAVPRGERAPRNANRELFDEFLTQDLIRLVELRYRVAPGAANRALAGLSVGASLTIYSGFLHPELFSALGIFSPPVGPDVDARLATADKGALNLQFDSIQVACGDNDNTVHYATVKAWSERLTAEGIHNTFVTYQGGHTWEVWQMSLADFAPLLFNRSNQ